MLATWWTQLQPNAGPKLARIGDRAIEASSRQAEGRAGPFCGTLARTDDSLSGRLRIFGGGRGRMDDLAGEAAHRQQSVGSAVLPLPPGPAGLGVDADQ